jgi:hypothetical protein
MSYPFRIPEDSFLYIGCLLTWKSISNFILVPFRKVTKINLKTGETLVNKSYRVHRLSLHPAKWSKTLIRTDSSGFRYWKLCKSVSVKTSSRFSWDLLYGNRSETIWKIENTKLIFRILQIYFQNCHDVLNTVFHIHQASHIPQTQCFSYLI